jgi:hypothetical protein
MQLGTLSVEEFQDNLAGVVYSGVLGGKHLEFPGMMWGGRDKAESMDEARMPQVVECTPMRYTTGRLGYSLCLRYLQRISL